MMAIRRTIWLVLCLVSAIPCLILMAAGWYIKGRLPQSVINYMDWVDNIASRKEKRK